MFCPSKVGEIFVIWFNWSRPKLCFCSPATEQVGPKLPKCVSLWIDPETSLTLFICQKLRGTIPSWHKPCPRIHFLAPSKHTAYFPTCSGALKKARLLFSPEHSQLNWKNEFSHQLRQKCVYCQVLIAFSDIARGDETAAALAESQAWTAVAYKKLPPQLVHLLGDALQQDAFILLPKEGLRYFYKGQSVTGKRGIKREIQKECNSCSYFIQVI